MMSAFDFVEADPGELMNEKYQPQEIEEKWQRRWDEEGTFEAQPDASRREY